MANPHLEPPTFPYHRRTLPNSKHVPQWTGLVDGFPGNQSDDFDGLFVMPSRFAASAPEVYNTSVRYSLPRGPGFREPEPMMSWTAWREV